MHVGRTGEFLSYIQVIYMRDTCVRVHMWFPFLLVQEISAEIDSHHDSYMDFMNQCLETPDLLERATQGIPIEEKHLIYLELMIMEQVEDWEMDIGKVNQESGTCKHRCL